MTNQIGPRLRATRSPSTRERAGEDSQSGHVVGRISAGLPADDAAAGLDDLGLRGIDLHRLLRLGSFGELQLHGRLRTGAANRQDYACRSSQESQANTNALPESHDD